MLPYLHTVRKKWLFLTSFNEVTWLIKKLSSLTFWLHKFENMKENRLRPVCTYLLPLNVTTSFKLLSSKINRVCRSMFWLYTLILQTTFHRFSGQCSCTHYISYNIHAKTAANTHKSSQEILRSDNYIEKVSITYIFSLDVKTNDCLA